MKIAIDISIYPMDKNYSPYIRAFIDRLKTYQGIELKLNPMSSQIFGEYDLCMDLIQKEIKLNFESGIAQNIILKIVNLDLSDL